jgi:drug/metabolite transporter (DMT)-like permease
MKKGMYGQEGAIIFSDVQVASIRMTSASLVLTPFAFKSIKAIRSGRTWIYLCMVGVFGNFFPAFLFTYAETGLSSGFTGMLNSFTPIFAILIGFLVFSNKLSRLQLTGIIIGTIGIVLLSVSGSDLSKTGGLLHILAIILATLCYAISINVIKYKLQGISGIAITSLAFLSILLPSLIVSIFSGSISVVKTNELAMNGLFYILILSVIGTAFAVILFNVLIANSSVVSHT